MENRLYLIDFFPTQRWIIQLFIRIFLIDFINYFKGFFGFSYTFIRFIKVEVVINFSKILAGDFKKSIFSFFSFLATGSPVLTVEKAGVEIKVADRINKKSLLNLDFFI